MFAAKYQQLYSSVPSEAAKIDAVQRCINEPISACPYDSGYALSAHEVSYAVSKLKANKHDGSIGLFTDHFKNALY